MIRSNETCRRRSRWTCTGCRTGPSTDRRSASSWTASIRAAGPSSRRGCWSPGSRWRPGSPALLREEIITALVPPRVRPGDPAGGAARAPVAVRRGCARPAREKPHPAGAHRGRARTRHRGRGVVPPGVGLRTVPGTAERGACPRGRSAPGGVGRGDRLDPAPVRTGRPGRRRARRWARLPPTRQRPRRGRPGRRPARAVPVRARLRPDPLQAGVRRRGHHRARTGGAPRPIGGRHADRGVRPARAWVRRRVGRAAARGAAPSRPGR